MVDQTTVLAVGNALDILTTATMAVLQLRIVVIQRKINLILSLSFQIRPNMGEGFMRKTRLLYSDPLDDF